MAIDWERMHDDVDDLDLLGRFARDGAEEAFAELVQRHLNLVHSAALRQVRSPQLAEEVAQSVFTDLARNAGKLKPGTVLAAWLYQVTRRTAIDVVRREARRQLREQVAVEMNAMNPTPSDWAQVEPLLDEAMAALDDTDRAAVLLRYFENKSLRDVGAALGTSDDTAQKRVSRAVDRLRDFFAQRGVTVGASAFTLAVSANAVQAAPVGLAAAVSTAFAATTLATTATATTTQAVTMITLKKTLAVAALAAAGGTGIYEARQAAELRDKVHALQQQQAPLTEQIQQVQRQRDKVAGQFAAAQREIEQLQRDAADIHRLRGEVTLLKQSSTELSNRLAAATNRPAPSVAQALQLRQRSEQPGTNVSGAAGGFGSEFGEALLTGSFQADDAVPAQPGAAQKPVIHGSPAPGALLIEWGKRWYPAEILETKGDKALIRYVGYDSSWDEWVGGERMGLYDAENKALKR